MQLNATSLAERVEFARYMPASFLTLQPFDGVTIHDVLIHDLTIQRFSDLTVAVITWTAITVWIISVLLAVGVGWSRWEQKKTRDRYLAELAAMDRDKREKVLSRLNPKLQMEIRQQLMLRHGIS